MTAQDLYRAVTDLGGTFVVRHGRLIVRMPRGEPLSPKMVRALEKERCGLRRLFMPSSTSPLLSQVARGLQRVWARYGL
jgi:hypothetical protein